jgi:hypothetical protein
MKHHISHSNTPSSWKTGKGFLSSLRTRFAASIFAALIASSTPSSASLPPQGSMIQESNSWALTLLWSLEQLTQEDTLWENTLWKVWKTRDGKTLSLDTGETIPVACENPEWISPQEQIYICVFPGLYPYIWDQSIIDSLVERLYSLSPSGTQEFKQALTLMFGESLFSLENWRQILEKIIWNHTDDTLPPPISDIIALMTVIQERDDGSYNSFDPDGQRAHNEDIIRLQKTYPSLKGSFPDWISGKLELRGTIE